MRRLATFAFALSSIACGSSPDPDCVCTLASGITLACGHSVCIEGAGIACTDGTASTDPSACESAIDGGPGSDAGVPASDASIDAPAAPACTSPLITRTGTTATLNTPQPGSCDGDVAVNCGPGMAPGHGHEVRTMCASTEECRTFTMEVFVAPSATSTTYTAVGSYAAARCVPAGATPVTYTFHAGQWTTTSPRMCDGVNRVSPVDIAQLPDTMQPEDSSMDPTSTAVASYGSPDGYVARNACSAGQHCVQQGEDLNCIADSAVPCTASRCEGSVLVACQGGFEQPARDCTTDGEICFTATPMAGMCNGTGEYAASCRPAGTEPCHDRTGDMCAADRHSHTDCDYESCAMLTTTCDASQTCYASTCIPMADFCDPTTTVASCTGAVSHTCADNGYRRDDDCSRWGMTCATDADASAPGAVRAGCVATTAATTDPCRFPTYCASNAIIECCDSEGLFNAPGATSSVACLPGRALAVDCGASYACTSHATFGITCDPR